MPSPLRLLTAVPICDGHDSAINTINLEFIRHGIEVIYLGYHRKTTDIARAAVQEDVRAIGLSSYNGGHVEFFAEVRAKLLERGGERIGLFGGGGGTITEEDAAQMSREGTDRIFFAGTPLDSMIAWVRDRYSQGSNLDDSSTSPATAALASRDLVLARRLTAIEESFARPVADPMATVSAASPPSIPSTQSIPSISSTPPPPPLGKKCRVVGITGPGGAGKTTLIDELVLRFLRTRPAPARVAILSHDPSMVGAGALLGDRATMIHSQDDRVFMRSMATRGQAGGLSPATGQCLELLATCGDFELVLIETVGIGQEAMPFMGGLVDQTLLVMNPDYGARLQLQKIAMLDLADVVAVNKSDLRGARTASAELTRRLGSNKRGQRLISTIANRHRDPGVDELFAALVPAPKL